MRGGNGLHAFQCFQSTLRLFSLGCLGPKAAHKIFDVRYLALLSGELSLLLCHSLCTLKLIG